MEKYLVFGHQNPDTDSVTAAIVLANLKRQLGVDAEERVLGSINKETKFVLDYFNVPEPKYLNDTKLKIKDIKYRKNCYLKEDKSIEDVYLYMQKHNTTGVPIVDNKKNFISLITAKDILKNSFYVKDDELYTSYDNVLKTIDGMGIVRNSEEVKGKVHAIAFAHETFENNTNIGGEDILIVGDRHHVIEFAIKQKVNLIIIVGGNEVKKEHIRLAKKNKVNIITTKLNTFETSRIILYSNYVGNLLENTTSYVIHEKDYYDDFINKSKEMQIDNYPVLDNNDRCLGLLRKSEISEINKRKVILVDHNELSQSAIGLEEAEITEIVDHHKLGSITTSSPINFRNMIVGSTNTILYFLYKENNVKITKQIAGLMLSGIISDTLLFKSPTTTETDLKVSKELNKIAKLNLNKFAMDMFKSGTSLEDMSIEDVLSTDSKTFKENNKTIIVSQMLTLNYEEILNNSLEYLDKMEEIKLREGVDHFIFSITDIINNGSYLLYDSESESLVKNAFKLKKIENGVYIPTIVSRKKQIIPKLMNALEKD